MPRSVLSGWPYSGQFRRVHFSGSDAALHAEQPIVWIVVAPTDVTHIDPALHRFLPAIVDSGFAGRVLLNHRHLAKWAGLQQSSLKLEPKTEMVYGQVLPRLHLKAWLLTQDPLLDAAAAYRSAFPLRVRDGVTKSIVAPWNQRPDLPLLGMRLFGDNLLRLTIDARKRTIDLDTERRW
ncbi:MAG: hypothetical protein L0211_13950 [Planctomycetaceae bacterium]|nr:hypothetical protein [Planctomycetaceae bacterium]